MVQSDSYLPRGMIPILVATAMADANGNDAVEPINVITFLILVPVADFVVERGILLDEE